MELLDRYLIYNSLHLFTDLEYSDIVIYTRFRLTYPSSGKKAYGG